MLQPFGFSKRWMIAWLLGLGFGSIACEEKTYRCQGEEDCPTSPPFRCIAGLCRPFCSWSREAGCVCQAHEECAAQEFCEDSHCASKKECPRSCSGKGTCDPTKGLCTCDLGYAGTACELCSLGYAGHPCAPVKECPLGCAGKGTCAPTTGLCTCLAGYSGAACDTCSSGYAGYPNCAVCPTGRTICGNLCADVTSDPNHCGRCNQVCPSGNSCQKGACQPIQTCGDGACDAAKGETCSSCPQDCKCPAGQTCQSSACQTPNSCGNGTCEAAKGETCSSCAADCKCPTGQTCQSSACVHPPPPDTPWFFSQEGLHAYLSATTPNHVHLFGRCFSSVQTFGSLPVSCPANAFYLAQLQTQDGKPSWFQEVLKDRRYESNFALSSTSDGIYVTGGQTSKSTGFQGITVEKYALGGTLQWSAEAATGGNSIFSQALAVSGGKVFLGGQFAPGTRLGGAFPVGHPQATQSGFLAELSPTDGSVLWHIAEDASLQSYVSSLDADATGLCIGGGANQIVRFGTESSSHTGFGGFVARMSFAKQFSFLRSTPGGAYSFQTLSDGAGGCYLAGLFEGSFSIGSKTVVSKGKSDLFLARLDSSGNVSWLLAGGSPETDYFGFLKAVGSSVYLGGGTERKTTASFGSLQVSSPGAERWSYVVKVGANGSFSSISTLTSDFRVELSSLSFSGSFGLLSGTLSAGSATTGLLQFDPSFGLASPTLPLVNQAWLAKVKLP